MGWGFNEKLQIYENSEMGMQVRQLQPFQKDNVPMRFVVYKEDFCISLFVSKGIRANQTLGGNPIFIIDDIGGDVWASPAKWNGRAFTKIPCARKFNSLTQQKEFIAALRQAIKVVKIKTRQFLDANFELEFSADLAKNLSDGGLIR